MGGDSVVRELDSGRRIRSSVAIDGGICVLSFGGVRRFQRHVTFRRADYKGGEDYDNDVRGVLLCQFKGNFKVRMGEKRVLVRKVVGSTHRALSLSLVWEGMGWTRSG